MHPHFRLPFREGPWSQPWLAPAPFGRVSVVGIVSHFGQTMRGCCAACEDGAEASDTAAGAASGGVVAAPAAAASAEMESLRLRLHAGTAAAALHACTAAAAELESPRVRLRAGTADVFATAASLALAAAAVQEAAAPSAAEDAGAAVAFALRRCISALHLLSVSSVSFHR